MTEDLVSFQQQFNKTFINFLVNSPESTLDDYINLVTSAKNQQRILLAKDNPNYIYYEKHHIQPKSFNGKDDPENLVLLKPGEHLAAHILLYKYCLNKFGLHSKESVKTIAAVMRQINNKILDDSSIEQLLLRYGLTKEKLMLNRSVCYQGCNNPVFGYKWMYNAELNKYIYSSPDEVEKYLGLGYIFQGKSKGKQLSDQAKKNISLAHADVSGANNPMYGKQIKDFMQQEDYDRWLYKVQHNKNGENNPVFGKILISNEFLQKQKYILPEDVSKYLDANWQIGELSTKNIKRQTREFALKNLSTRNPEGDFSNFDYDEYITLKQGHPRRKYILNYIKNHPKEVDKN